VSFSGGRGIGPCTISKPVVLDITSTWSLRSCRSTAPLPARRFLSRKSGSQSGRSGFTYMVRTWPLVWIPHRTAIRRKTDAAGQAVARIGGDTFDRRLLTVQAKVVGAFFFPPKALVEFLVQANGAIPHLGGLLLLAPDLVSLRHANQCIEGVALQLAKRVG